MTLEKAFLLLLIIPCCISGFGDNFEITAATTFVVNAQVEDSKGAFQSMVFDTGSTHSWIFDYRLLDNFDGYVGGGFSHTQVRTYVDVPHGASQILYEDSDMVECDTWTRKAFVLGNTKWIQHFGIVTSVKRRSLPRYSGLMAANLASDFVSTFPVFSFEPRGKRKIQMFLGPLDVANVCVNGRIAYANLVDPRSRFGEHWFITGPVLFGTIPMGRGSIIDTGASVVGLPPGSFEAFTNEIRKHATSFVYHPKLLHATIDCPSDIRVLPSFEILVSATESVSVTSAMYVLGLTRSLCIVNVARLRSDSAPVIFGLPLLKNLASEFDSTNRRIGFCQSTSWSHDGGVHEYSQDFTTKSVYTVGLFLVVFLTLI